MQTVAEERRVFPKSRSFTMALRVALTWAAAAPLVSGGAEAQTLRGSPASVDRIHRQALAHDLRFYANAEAIRSAHRRGELVRLEPNSNFGLADVSHPYVLPETHTFVLRLAGQYRSACGERMIVTSATRPTSMRLANSVDRSVHPTGMAIDLRRPSNARCLAWLRRTLLTLEGAGVLEAVEERFPPHFHVAVFPRQYGRYVQARTGQPTRLAAATPAPRPRAAVPDRPAPGRSYQVRRGDSLWTIARRNQVTVENLREANSLRSTTIVAGQILVIPEAR